MMMENTSPDTLQLTLQLEIERLRKGLQRLSKSTVLQFPHLHVPNEQSCKVGCLGVVLALLGREGKAMGGDRLEVPLAAGLCDALVFNSMSIPSLPPRYLTMRELEIAKKREKKEEMRMNYRQVKALLDPFYHT